MRMINFFIRIFSFEFRLKHSKVEWKFCQNEVKSEKIEGSDLQRIF